MRKISVCDFTLKQLMKEKHGEVLFREKLAVAKSVCASGVDAVELPPIFHPKEDAVVYKTVAASLENCTVSVPVGYDEKSIDTAWECIKYAKNPCLVISLPVATAQMEYSFRMKEAAMLEKVEKLIVYAKTKCDKVEFEALDATRADGAFLEKAVCLAEKCGATQITLCDDAAVSLPDETAALVSFIKTKIAAALYVSFSDASNMAVANAVYALKAGADGVKTSMMGKDVLLCEKFAETVESKEEKTDFCTSLKFSEIHRNVNSVISAVLGTALLSKDTDGIDIFLDGKSSLSDTASAVRSLGYELGDDDFGKIHRAMLQICEKKSSVGAKELEALIASNAMQVPSTYHLISYTVNCTNLSTSMAQVSYECRGETYCGVATGDGPIDAAFRAVEQSIGYHYELDDFQISTVTQGKESLGSAVVILRNNGKLYSGNGLSTDIVGASIRAYINALNKIVYEEM